MIQPYPGLDQLSAAVSINSSGQILAYSGNEYYGGIAYVLKPLPDPSTATLLFLLAPSLTQRPRRKRSPFV